MSPINLEDLVKENPKQGKALEMLGRWLEQHNDALLYPGILSRELAKIDAYDLAVALQILTQAGLLSMRYKVITPSGVYADGEFEELSSIPPRLPDRFNHFFDTAEADVTPVFRREVD